MMGEAYILGRLTLYVKITLVKFCNPRMHVLGRS